MKLQHKNIIALSVIATILLIIPQPYTTANGKKGRTNGFNMLFRKGKDINY